MAQPIPTCRPAITTATWPTLTAPPAVSDGLPVRIDGNRDYGWWRRAPMLGEHNREILAELGFTPSEISSLEASGVIGNRPTGQ